MRSARIKLVDVSGVEISQFADIAELDDFVNARISEGAYPIDAYWCYRDLAEQPEMLDEAVLILPALKMVAEPLMRPTDFAECHTIPEAGIVMTAEQIPNHCSEIVSEGPYWTM